MKEEFIDGVEDTAEYLGIQASRETLTEFAKAIIDANSVVDEKPIDPPIKDTRDPYKELLERKVDVYERILVLKGMPRDLETLERIARENHYEIFWRGLEPT